MAIGGGAALVGTAGRGAVGARVAVGGGLAVAGGGVGAGRGGARGGGGVWVAPLGAGLPHLARAAGGRVALEGQPPQLRSPPHRYHTRLVHAALQGSELVAERHLVTGEVHIHPMVGSTAGT